MDLDGQRVVILGGTSGIGLATAKAAARCGAEVTVISRQPASVDRALAELPPGASGRTGDLTDAALVCALFGDLGDIDHLVFTAGEPLALTDMAALDLDKAREFFALRYFGAGRRTGTHPGQRRLSRRGPVTAVGLDDQDQPRTAVPGHRRVHSGRAGRRGRRHHARLPVLPHPAVRHRVDPDRRRRNRSGLKGIADVTRAHHRLH
jgi:NAD(P)-dependent dehydrogenase (short-subunit alcohol dehydrogenase family)